MKRESAQVVIPAGPSHKGLNPLPQSPQGVKVPKPPPPTSTGVAPSRAPRSLGPAGASAEDRQTHLPFGSMLSAQLSSPHPLQHLLALGFSCST